MPHVARCTVLINDAAFLTGLRRGAGILLHIVADSTLSEQFSGEDTVLRAEVEPNKGRLRGPAARAPFDAIMSRTIPRKT